MAKQGRTTHKHYRTRGLAILPLLAAAVLALAGCIHNDIPYPYIQPNFVSFEVLGQEGGTSIDSATRTVAVPLDESVDIYAARVASYSITPGAELLDDIFGEPVDLSAPLRVTLRLYQDYVWTIKATQTIERYFEVEGQIGQSVIDVPGRRIVVQVRQGQDLTKVKVVRAKLANEGSVITPDIAEGGTLDCRRPATLRVEVFGHVEEWTLYVEVVQESVRTVAFDAWTNVGWIYGQAEAGAENGAQYRLQGDSEWITVPEANITHSGGAFTARIEHLSAGATYEARATSGSDYGSTLTATTGSAPQLPNSNFDNWWLDGKIWCPWAQDAEPYWGTGNKGATTLGPSNTVPTEDTPTGTGWAAQLETKFVGIGVIGKLAAGNLFAGTYVRTDGTNGILEFGRPFKERPTKLRGMFKYTCAPISHADNGHKDLIGQPDTCIIWVALIDSDNPFEIRTNPKNLHLFDPEGAEVIAYGSYQLGQTQQQWIPFEFELDYRSTSRVPKYILVTSSASKYGDYFTGGNGSILYLDDFELVYDY